MRSIPLDIGALHFVGIGGIGMSGIAEILHNLGYVVQGSDVAENANVQRLRGLGITCAVGHDAANLGDARVVVVSTAITTENPEVAAARAAFIPIVRRAEMLAELMRLKWSIAVGGTHGKTTTTSLISTVLDSSKLDPTIINGGIINAYGTNARLGQGDWMVVEADESDGTFLKLPATVAVVTNIDPEHLDHYGTFDKIREAFRTFIENLPFYGSAVMCIDHPEVQALIAKITDRRILSYGLSPQADLRATDLRMARDGATFAVTLADRRAGTETDLGDFHSPMLGEHNVRNALAAIGVGLELKIPADTIRAALSGFEGVKRRFTRTGEVNGITVIDDYGHHPVEISATLKAGRQHTEGRVIAVMQPHRYTRLRDLFEDFCTCFNNADTVIITDVYAAGEEPIEGVSRDDLVKGLIAHGHRHAIGLESRGALASTVLENATSGDVVICLGAGTISAWAQALPEEMEKHASS